MHVILRPTLGTVLKLLLTEAEESTTMFAVITRSHQKFKESPPTPSRGQVMRDKFLGIAQKFISHLSVPGLGAGLGVGKVIH